MTSGSGGSNYKLVLNASIDPKQVNTQLNQIAKDYVFHLKVQVDATDTAKITAQLNQVQQNIASKSKNVSLIDTKSTYKDLNEIQARFQKLRDTLDKEAKITISSGGNGEANKAVISYSDGLGKAVTETIQLKEVETQVGNQIQKNNEWMLTSVTATDNVAKAEAAALKIEKDRGKELEKLGLQADKFLEKTKFLSTSHPEVAKGIDIANQLKASIAADQATGQLSEKTKQLGKDLSVVNEGVRTGGRTLQSWSQEIGIAIKRTLEWSVGIGLVYGSLNQLRSGVEYIKELNKVMTDTAVVNGMSAEQTTTLTKSYTSLAKDLGSTTKAVAEGGLAWQRQGKSIADTTELLRTSTMMSKLANMESSEATQRTTSIMMGFKLEASDMMGVLDKLVNLDNNYASSVSEISEALSRSSNSASQAGVSFEQLAAMITVTSAVTQRSGESIGEAYKTMFARMQDIQQGGMDETGISINNVEEALDRVDIQLRDSTDSFRPLGAVLTDIASKWNFLSETEQSNISKSIAGKTNARTYSNIWKIYNN
jgi:TP901 family phage tail tape measure protein